MLKIRSEQFEAFKPVAEDGFVRRLAEHVRARHPRVVVRLPERLTVAGRLDDETLRALVRGGVARARRYGMEAESALAAFVVTMFLTAPNFDEHPLIRRVLADDKIPPDGKIDQLLQSVTAKNLKVVKDTYNPAAWHEASEGGAA
ncbi:MAG TPA: hypothetical protein VF240_08155 [Pyrinomonadaceae bacterium]